MQLALTILAGIGALLFIFSFLAYAISGFKHHFVTGLISLLPVLNIVTLPSLWDRNSRKFFVGLIGLSLTVAAWFMGADKGIQNLVSRDNNTLTEEVIVSSLPSGSTDNQQISNNTNAIQPKTKKALSFNEDNMRELPNKALYRMNFDVIPVSKIAQLKGRIVQITKNDNEQIEGRIKRIEAGSIVLGGLYENEHPIASIKQLKLMVKKAN